MTSDREQAGNRRWWHRTLVWFSRGFLATGALVLLLELALPLLPLPAALFEPLEPGLEIVDRRGQALRVTTGEGEQFLHRAAFGELPPVLLAATIAAEDKRFWRHRGIDWAASGRASRDLIRYRRVTSGGSTITQQLIKLACPRPRTVWTKMLEAVQARRLEQVWDKQRILREYLARLDYGHLNRGAAAAAEFYFAKPLRDLSTAEAALLAGLPQAPSRLDPHRHRARAVRRQRWVLQQMAAAGAITAREYDRAIAEPLRFCEPHRVFRAPHFIDFLLLQDTLAHRSKERIETTLDLELNDVVQKTVRDAISRLRDRHVLNGAAVVLDNASGDILALVGSENYFSPNAGQVNGTLACRSPGSTLKPFTYLLALEHGATPASIVADVPVEFATPTGVFAPVNYDRHCYGPVRYRLALANSLNIAAVQVLQSVGGPEVLFQRLRECGLTTLTKSPEHYGLGLTLGNPEVRLLELANAYACLARLGIYKSWRWTKELNLAARQVCDPAACYLIADILDDDHARVLAFGGESDLRFDFPVACKTGTSTDFRDNWIFGYTPEFTVGVWVGNFDGTPMEGISGVTGAGPIFHRIFVHLHQRYGTSWYEPPPSIVELPIRPVTGKRVANNAGDIIRERFVRTTLPIVETADDYDAGGRIRLGAEYRAWFDSGDNWLRDRAVVTDADTELRLLRPLPGTTFFLDPDLPDAGARAPLQANGPVDLWWESDSLECRREGETTVALLKEGRHRITVRTGAGESVETWIVVKKL